MKKEEEEKKKLTMHIKLQHVPLDALARIKPLNHLAEPVHHAPQPRHMALVQVPHRPNVAALNQGQQVQTANGLAVPVQVGQQQEPLVGGGRSRGAVPHGLLLGAALDDVEDPVEAALVALGLHVGADVGGVDGGGFGHEAHGLGRVFLDVGGRARVDEVDLQIGGLLLGCAGSRWRVAGGLGGIAGHGLGGGRCGAGKVPAVDVVVA